MTLKKWAILVPTIVLCIFFIVIAFNKTSKNVLLIKNGYFEGMKNKTVGELINIISYNKSKWKEIDQEKSDADIIIIAHWTNQYNKDIKFFFKLSSGSEFVKLVDIYFDDLSQGWIRIAFFLDIFRGLEQGKKLEKLIKHNTQKGG